MNNLRVEFDELDYVSKTMERDRTELEAEIKRLQASLERIKQAWSGDDLEKFYEKADAYVNRMIVLCDFLTASSTFIEKGVGQYQNQDETFSRELDKEKEEEEPYEYREN